VTPLPGALGTGAVRFCRMDRQRHAGTRDSGEGAFQMGRRWNARGVRAVCAALDPATACLQVAVHKGFAVIDTQAHVLTSALILDPAQVHVGWPQDMPNPNWLMPARPSRNRQAFGDVLLAARRFVARPSGVSHHNWTLVFRADRGPGGFGDVQQARFALDPRLQG
jgi:RES domain-containing protein